MLQAGEESATDVSEHVDQQLTLPGKLITVFRAETLLGATRSSEHFSSLLEGLMFLSSRQQLIPAGRSGKEP